jgi:hypothetical protein
MTIKELKRLIEDIPDDAAVGMLDEFGALVEIDLFDCRVYDAGEHWREKERFLCLPRPDLGTPPD